MNAPINSRIKLLPQPVIEKIAAGEVIERPASVVKEFVENALDAGATRIDVVVEESGFSLIKVMDNGCGMGQEDISKCLLRYATSKIATAEDLFAIATLGFRGEALASIAAVSRFTIASSDKDEGMGYAISSEGGTVYERCPTQHTRGTTVVCRDLFYNVPARKKFMKSAKAERMAIVRLIENMVISFPAVHFTCTVDGRRSIDVPKVNTVHMRIAQIGGTEFAKKLIRCHGEAAGMSAQIYITGPDDAKARPTFQNLYVNLRRVDNDSVTYAVREAFSRFITFRLKPSWFCFLDVDPSHVDVNIHPTKQKIKFDDEKALFSFIYSTVFSSVSSAVDVRHKLAGRTEEQPPDTGGKYTDSGSKPVGADSPQNIGFITPDKPPQSTVQTTLPFLSILDDEKFVEKEIRYGED